MATRAPARAKCRAMPRPIRLAAPVTRITFPARLDGWLAMNLYLLARDALDGRFGQAAREVGPCPEECRGGAKRAGDSADETRAIVLRSDASSGHGQHHDRPLHRFHGGEDTPAVLVGHAL